MHPDEVEEKGKRQTAGLGPDSCALDSSLKCFHLQRATPALQSKDAKRLTPGTEQTSGS